MGRPVRRNTWPRLCQLIEQLKPQERPALVRGDNAFGNEGVMAEDGSVAERASVPSSARRRGSKCLIERE